MRIGQYAYFTLYSPSVSAKEMAARLGVEPDEASIRGSRPPVPPRPAAHALGDRVPGAWPDRG